MPQISLPLDPVILAGMRPPTGGPMPSPPASPFTPPPMPDMPGPGGPKIPLLRKPMRFAGGPSPMAPPMGGPPPGLAGPPSTAPGPSGGIVGLGNPFTGNQNPGTFTTPAPFNPLLAQILLGSRGLGPSAPVGGIMPRGPMGALGLTPEQERPRGRAANPYRS